MERDALIRKVAKSLEKKYSTVTIDDFKDEPRTYSLRYPVDATSVVERKDYFNLPQIAMLKDLRAGNKSQFVVEPVTVERKRQKEVITEPVHYSVRMPVSTLRRHGFKQDAETFLDEFARAIVAKERKKVLANHKVDCSTFTDLSDPNLQAALKTYDEEIKEEVRKTLRSFDTIQVKISDTGAVKYDKKNADDPKEYEKLLSAEIRYGISGDPLLSDVSESRVVIQVNVGNVKGKISTLRETVNARRETMEEIKEDEKLERKLFKKNEKKLDDKEARELAKQNQDGVSL